MTITIKGVDLEKVKLFLIGAVLLFGLYLMVVDMHQGLQPLIDIVADAAESAKAARVERTMAAFQNLFDGSGPFK